MEYRDEVQAVKRAINCGVGRPVSSKWQQQYSSGYRESHLAGEPMTAMDRLLADSVTHSLLHTALAENHYWVLVLKYSEDDKEKIKALRVLMAVVGTKAGPYSRALSIGAWAGYKSKNANYDQQQAAESTIRGWRNTIRKRLDRLRKEALTAAAVVLSLSGKIPTGGIDETNQSVV